MPLHIVRNDITKMHADAIVNTANYSPTIGGGTDTGIYMAAGPELLKQRETIGIIPVGESVITPAYRLTETNHIKYIIHTSGTDWRGGNYGEEDILRSCYHTALTLAKENQCKSVAFPLLAAGSFGFPLDTALCIAEESIRAFLSENELYVYLVLFDTKAFRRAKELFGKYIDEHITDDHVEQQQWNEYLTNEKMGLDISIMEMLKSLYSKAPLDQRIAMRDDVFAVELERLMQQKGLTAPQVYKAAFMTSQAFNRIIRHPDSRPNKQTAIQLALALELSLDQTQRFIGRAGYTLNNTDISDIIVKYFIQNEHYDILDIDRVLVKYGQKRLSKEK